MNGIRHLMMLLKFGLGLGFRRGTGKAFTVSLQLLTQLNTLDKTRRCEGQSSYPSSSCVDSHCLIINYSCLYQNLMVLEVVQQKKYLLLICVSYRGAIILTEHIFTSGFVRLDMQTRVYIPQGELSVFRAPIHFILNPERSDTYLLD